jgi:hypothetical protein
MSAHQASSHLRVAFVLLWGRASFFAALWGKKQEFQHEKLARLLL